jgi:hypothetical protein
MAYWRISVSETAGKSKGDIGLEYVLENLIKIFHKTAEAAIGTGDLRLGLGNLFFIEVRSIQQSKIQNLQSLAQTVCTSNFQPCIIMISLDESSISPSSRTRAG